MQNTNTITRELYRPYSTMHCTWENNVWCTKGGLHIKYVHIHIASCNTNKIIYNYKSKSILLSIVCIIRGRLIFGALKVDYPKNMYDFKTASVNLMYTIKAGIEQSHSSASLRLPHYDKYMKTGKLMITDFIHRHAHTHASTHARTHARLVSQLKLLIH